MRGAAAVAALAVAAAAAAARPRRVVVRGTSMAPTLEPGDRLVVVRVPKLRPGQVVALRDPRRPDRLLVKRVAGLEGDRVVVWGDNPAESTDSREFGPVGRASVLGAVVHRYGPAGRAGPLCGVDRRRVERGLPSPT